MIDFILLLIVPLLISIGAMIYFRGKITWVEFLCQAGVLILFVAACVGLSYYQATSDKELWNGQVVDKKRLEVSCRHSYRCHCHEVCSGSGNSRSCSEECDTCYEHSYDVDWNVYASLGAKQEEVSIDTIDRQGLKMPPRWGRSYIGEPWTSQHTYENYILANPDSVLTGGKGDVKKWSNWHMIPDYPGVFDYYRSNHFINLAVPNVDFNTWNWLVNEANKTLGPKKQVNILVILVKTADSSYAQALRTAWLGGKKNDAVVVIGSQDGHKIEFVDVISWAVRADFRDNLRQDIRDIGTLDQRDAIIKAIYDETDNRFVRMHMKDMEYLMRSFQPSGTAMWITFILGCLVSLGISFGFLKYYEDEHGWERNWWARPKQDVKPKLYDPYY